MIQWTPKYICEECGEAMREGDGKVCELCETTCDTCSKRQPQSQIIEIWKPTKTGSWFAIAERICLECLADPEVKENIIIDLLVALWGKDVVWDALEFNPSKVPL